jgi:hypothetical protein
MNITNSFSGFFARVHLIPDHIDKPDLNHHESHRIQGSRFLIHNPFDMFSGDSAVHQTIVNHSIIVHLNPVKTIIDKALKNFKPKRFG